MIKQLSDMTWQKHSPPPAAPRYLKDVNNQFHQGAAISFYELVTGVQSVDEAPWVEFGFVVAVVQLDEMR